MKTPVAENLPKPFFISIIPNFAGKEEYLADLIRNRNKETGIEYFAMSYPLHPQGDDVYDKVRIHLLMLVCCQSAHRHIPVL